VAVKIRLKRMGRFVRRTTASSSWTRARSATQGDQEIGKYHPKEDPSYIDVVSERAQYWLGVGAQPTEAVEVILKITGDWQTFKGLPGTEGTLQVAAPKRDKLEIFNEALKEASSEPKGGAVTRRAAKKAAAPAEPAAEARRPRRGAFRGPR
jgi:small subunit ribosomal protein S16